MSKKNNEDGPEVWEDWNDDWADDYLHGIEVFGDDGHEDHSNIASLGGDYYKMFVHTDKHRNF